jgi:hypothetical protein
MAFAGGIGKIFTYCGYSFRVDCLDQRIAGSHAAVARHRALIIFRGKDI